MDFLLNIIQAISLAFNEFLNNVLFPFWDSFVSWVKTFIPWTESFADFCMNIFKFRYMGRVYSFMITFPIIIAILLIGIIPRSIKSRRMKRRRKR